MNIITILTDEHQKILSFCSSLEEQCLETMNTKTINYKYFEEAISFIKEFADATHHKKEEDILFKYMMEHLQGPTIKLIKNGMLVEHDLARFEVRELTTALASHQANPNNTDLMYVITHAMSYCFLLRRHIDKEDNVVYPFATKNLSAKIIDTMLVEL